MDAIDETSLTITLRNVLPHETIGDLIKRTRLQGKRFKVSITVEDIPTKSTHPLADYLLNHHPFSGLSEQMNQATGEVRENLSDKLFEQFAK